MGLDQEGGALKANHPFFLTGHLLNCSLLTRTPQLGAHYVGSIRAEPRRDYPARQTC